jgi:uncharacterized protein YjbI with pentapeptide repeats
MTAPLDEVLGSAPPVTGATLVGTNLGWASNVGTNLAGADLRGRN